MTSFSASVFQEGDEVMVADSIHVGALVYFERSGPREVTVHLVPNHDPEAVEGPVYQALPADEPDVVRFVLVEKNV